MTPKERFMAWMTYQPVDRPPNLEITMWGQTKERWLAEGMPEGLNTSFKQIGEPYFGLEGYDTVTINATGPVPWFEDTVLEETDEHLVFLDGFVLERNVGARCRGSGRG